MSGLKRTAGQKKGKIENRATKSLSLIVPSFSLSLSLSLSLSFLCTNALTLSKMKNQLTFWSFWSSSSPDCFIHAMSHSKMRISQCTEISTSSKLWPAVRSLKYPIWSSSSSWGQVKSLLWSLPSSVTWMVTSELNGKIHVVSSVHLFSLTVL